MLVCFQVVKKLWAYIRENNLQDENNRRKILPDERLKKIFNVNSIDMFQMNKALTKHIWPLDSDGTNPSYSKFCVYQSPRLELVEFAVER